MLAKTLTPYRMEWRDRLIVGLTAAKERLGRVPCAREVLNAVGVVPFNPRRSNHVLRERWGGPIRELYAEVGITQLRRGSPPWRIYQRKTHCIRGHAYTPENRAWVRTQRSNPAQRCRACNSELARKLRRERRDGREHGGSGSTGRIGANSGIVA